MVKVAIPDQHLPAEELGPVHFIGVGGAGLSAIARIMVQRGVPVSGSDANPSALLDGLTELGVRTHVGHDPAHLADARTVVVSTAVREDNVEYAAALRAGLRILPRSAGLMSAMSGKQVLAVSGTHGKTTTSAMLTVALQSAGLDPAYAVGSTLANTGDNARWTGGQHFVAEADESDGAFLVYDTHGIVLTNIEADHLDVWGTPEAYRAAFVEFVDKVPAGGFIVAVIDDPGCREVLARAGATARVLSVGHSLEATFRLSELVLHGNTTRFVLTVPHHEDIDITLNVAGEHYALDAAAAFAAAWAAGGDPALIAAGLRSFTGTARRMEFVGSADQVRVYDSYAHHPQEISGDLAAARSIAGEGRVVVAFQPHLVSRTRIFGAEMGAALAGADEVVVTDIYLAREDPDPDVTGEWVARRVPKDSGLVGFVPDLADLPADLVARVQPGDLVLTLGAGTITTVAPQVVALLAERR